MVSYPLPQEKLLKSLLIIQQGPAFSKNKSLWVFFLCLTFFHSLDFSSCDGPHYHTYLSYVSSLMKCHLLLVAGSGGKTQHDTMEYYTALLSLIWAVRGL